MARPGGGARLLGLALVTGVGDEVGGVSVAEDLEGFSVAVLLDEAVAGEVAARGVSGDEVLLGEEGLGSGVVARGKVDLGEPEGVVVVAWVGIRGLATALQLAGHEAGAWNPRAEN
jgi:hypothetical protein